MAVKIQVEVFWVVTLRSFVVGYRRFGGLWRRWQQGPPKLYYPTATQHGITTQKILTWNII